MDVYRIVILIDTISYLCKNDIYIIFQIVNPLTQQLIKIKVDVFKNNVNEIIGS